MSELALHFPIDEGEDAETVAQELKAQLEGVPGVESVRAQAEQPQFGVAEVLVVLTIIHAAATLPEDLAKIRKTWDALRRRLKRKGSLETGLDRVSVDEATDLDLQEAVDPGA